ncbi:virulence factor BrkB family protein [Thalassotalea sp. HSM 43]|uniref:virulence factor BrkB family protein n=1 Tax=Thalassotalea sp. HSM 43 TaxID=2552945 RepID=UPI001081EB51|nr:virulence factor BrkB family protein [Thalassotalea sp. HSM 43]QBY03883.1 virulence factor BrkB family protein [Thalassotalea sp. HSM 43]
MKLSQILTRYRKLAPVLRFGKYFVERCQRDQIQVSAGYLSYVTLMSLVPLVMVMFSIVTAFPIFGELHKDIEKFVFSNFVPTASETIQDHIDGFVANASQMSATAIFALFVLAMMLIYAVDKALNRIWRIHKHRKVITSFAIYWMILTLGPVLMGVSILATSYIVSLVSFGGQDVNSLLLRGLPFIASWAGFIVLYMLVPNTEVKFKYALAGSMFGTILFEVAKKAFAAYVTHLPSYEAIYGALATIPILFVWVYVSWLVVFIGAEFTVCLQELAEDKPQTDEKID